MNLLVTGAFPCDKEEFSAIKKLNNKILFMQKENEALPCKPEWVEGVICNGLFLYHPIERFTSLKYIQLTSAGFDRVPLDYITEKGISIFNAKGVYSVPMAEFALCAVLQLYKKMVFFYENQKSRKWEKHRGLLELFGKTVCIVGCGNVGNECAKRFSVFGCDVVGVDIKPYKSQLYNKMFSINEITTALQHSDVVILTLPLSDITRHLMNADCFDAMKRGALLVNISRGAIVNTKDLINALSNHLGGAVLDVFEEEPLSSDSQLWNMENVIITPHNSFVGEGNTKRLTDVILNNLKEYSK